MHEGRLVVQGSVDELALTCQEFQRLTALQRWHPHEAAPREAPDPARETSVSRAAAIQDEAVSLAAHRRVVG